VFIKQPRLQCLISEACAVTPEKRDSRQLGISQFPHSEKVTYQDVASLQYTALRESCGFPNVSPTHSQTNLAWG
jgi:hypothetical protein